MADSAFDAIIKKRITMYYKGDKRLAVSKLISKLKSRKLMHGGEGEEYIIDGTSYTKGKTIGSGAFADVFALVNKEKQQENLEYCIKIFKTDQPDIIQNIKTFGKQFPSLQGTTLLSNLSCSDNCYFMKRMIRDVSFLKKLVLYKPDLSDKICDVLASFKPYKFVHGDIKLANILVDSNDSIAVTDFDNVLTYNDRGTICTFEGTEESPRSVVKIAVTPLFTHPLYFVWVKYHKDLFSDLNITGEQALEIWEKAVSGNNPKIVDAMKKVLEPFTASFASKNIIDKISTFDTYSFAMSLLYECILQKPSYECAKVWGELASTEDKALVSKYEAMYKKACDLLQSCFFQQETSMQGGKKKKTYKGGASVPLQELRNDIGEIDYCDVQQTKIINIDDLFRPTL